MAVGNPWFSAVEQTLPQHVPLPFQELAMAGQAIQGRYDTAMAGLDATATGIASIEARLPGHQQYVSEYANKFRTEADELLSKYNYNAADPQFGRELTRLRSRYANDPNLRTISMANQMYDANLKTRQKLMESGQRFIDTTRGRTGIDPETGRLTADTGIIRATKYDEDLRTMFRDTIQATINDGRGRVTNEAAIANTVENLMSGGANNPVLREGMEYYMSQGMNPEQAQQQLQLDIQREAASALKIDKDWGADTSARGWANIDLQKQRLNFDQAKEMAKQNRAGALVALNSPLDAQNLNKELIKEADAALRGAAGNNTPFKSVPDTPENRAKYPGAERIAGGSAGTGAPGTGPLLRITNEQAEQATNEFVESARDEISHILQARGINPATANREQILNNYKEYLEADNNAPTFWTSPVKEIRENFTAQYFGAQGQNLHDAIIEDRKGNITRVAGDKKALDGLKGFDFTGVTSSPIKKGGQEFSGGAIKGTAVDDDGNIVNIYKPLPPSLQQAIPWTNLVSRAMITSNNNLKRDPSYRMTARVPDTDEIITLVPQKRDGAVKFYKLNQDGSLSNTPAGGLEDKVNAERNLISQYFSLHQNTD